MEKRILFINNSLGYSGGAEKSLYYLIKHLSNSKFHIYLMVSGDDALLSSLVSNINNCRIFKKPLLPTRIRKNIFPMKKRFASYLSYMINISRLLLFSIYLLTFIIKHQISIVYCNNLIPMIVGTIAGALTHRSVIWHERNIHVSKLRRKFLILLSKIPVVKYIICVSKAAYEQYGEESKKARVVYSGIDLSEYNKPVKPLLRKEYNISNKDLIVGYHGRFAPWKGLDIFLNAAKEICKRRKDVKFVILGDASIDKEINYKKKIMELIRDLNINDRIILTGFKEDIKSYIIDFDICVIPSIRPDPFPRAALEAMAMGKPVIGTNIGGVTESVIDGETGYLIPPRDAKALCEKILLLLNNKRQRRDFGNKGERYIKALFNVEEKTKEIERLLLEL